jgi:hypothetical protein
MFLADSIRARRGAGAAIAAALDFCFPKCEKLSLTSYVADRRPKRAEHVLSMSRSLSKLLKKLQVSCSQSGFL